MARTSRKAILDQTGPSSPEAVYQVAFYLRLSEKDCQRGVSNSIENQKELLLEFIKDKPELSLVSVFQDDGKTGVNFERSGFKQLMDAVRAGTINCIIVKDLSRLGRNYLEAGNYIETVFPFLNVRFIAVTDHFDTQTATASQLAWLMPLKNVMNENYARDISKKERSSKKILRRQGSFLGAYGAYGYKKSREDKHRLVIDEEAAVYVKTIYDMYKAGYGDAAIAKYLNDNQVASPARYKYEKGILHDEKYANTSGWYPQRVAAILTNRIYIGDVVQGIQTCVGIKGKKVVVLRDDWDIVAAVHEPIIAKEQFEEVQQIRALRQSCLKKDKLVSEPGLFRGKLYCGDCKKAMSRKKIKGCQDQYRYICEIHERNGMCSRKYLRETDLLETVRSVIGERIAVSVDMMGWISAQERETEQNLRQWDQKLCALKQKREHISCKRAMLYRDWKEGLVDKDGYNHMREQYGKEAAAFDEEIMNRKRQKHEYIQHRTVENPAITAASNMKERFVLSQQMVDEFIEKIEVYERNRVKVTLSYQDELRQAPGWWNHQAGEGDEKRG